MEFSLKDQILSSHETFRMLEHEHSQYSKRLEILAEKRFLSDEEKLEEVRLKKLKLRLKDQMSLIERQYKGDHQVA